MSHNFGTRWIYSDLSAVNSKGDSFLPCGTSVKVRGVLKTAETRRPLTPGNPSDVWMPGNGPGRG